MASRYSCRDRIQFIEIRFALAQDGAFDLRCENRSRRLDRPEIDSLIATAERDYFKADRKNWPAKLPQLIDLGRRLYRFLDGPDGWLRTGLNGGGALFLNLGKTAEDQLLSAETRTLVQQLAHLPWELLHDHSQFLAARGVVPVRVMTTRPAVQDEPANRPLRLLFMATSPEDVQPVLDFEGEESAILDATAKQPIHLVVEESGSVDQLADTIDFSPNAPSTCFTSPVTARYRNRLRCF